MKEKVTKKIIILIILAITVLGGKNSVEASDIKIQMAAKTNTTNSVNQTNKKTTTKKNTSNQTNKNTTTNTNKTNTTSKNTTKTNSVKGQDLKDLKIKNYTLTPEFDAEVYEYHIDVNDNITNLTIETETASNVTVDIAGNENFSYGENTFTLMVYNEKTKKNSTYQIIVNKNYVETEKVEEENVNEALEKGLKIRKIGLIALGALVLFCIVIFIILGRNKEDEDEKYEYDVEDKKRLGFLEEDDVDDEEDVPIALRKNKRKEYESQEKKQKRKITSVDVDYEKITKRGKHF